MSDNTLTRLNPAQRKAVTEGDGPTLVLAGAGSGKTRVIVERLAYLVGERGVDPRNLLAVTFTNRAADEMRSRVAQRLGMARLAAWVGTFHGFGLFVLRREIEALGRSKNFTIFDDADQLSLMKRLAADLPRNLPKVSPREALQWISGFKQDLRTPGDESTGRPEDETFRALWHAYHDALVRADGVDFDDLLVLTARLLDEHPDVREKYSRRYRYVHVDEYQDTNRAQYRIARRLSESHGNLFVVGDEDQSIYSWRGADIDNILNFERDFPGAQIIRLEQNYRSTPQILAAANAVVANNAQRLGKTLRTDGPKGPAVRFYHARDGEDEARFVADEIAGGETAPRDIAVLYRTNGQARLIEEALRRKGLAYKVVGGVSFYGRKEIKDLVAYLRLLVNPSDDVSLRRVLNVPPRGIGGVTLERIEEYATLRGTPLFQVLRDVEHDQTLPARARSAMADFVHLIDDLALEARDAKVAPLVKALLDRTGYREFVEKSDERDYKTRLEFVDEFLSACTEYDQKGGQNLSAFLQEFALVSDLDTYKSDDPGVTLMTVHSAKGLEFDEIFLIGLEEGLLPHASALESDRELEEERRLCYVAMTRARRRLTLTAAQARVVYGSHQRNEVSRFIEEIPRGSLEWCGFEDPEPRTMARPTAPRAESGLLKMGTRVRHAQFGNGVVMYTKGSGDKQRVRIRFETGRLREFMVSHAPLEIIEGRKHG